MQLFKNNAESTLAASIDAVETTIVVATGEGAKFPAISGADYFLITLLQKVGATEANWEIVKCTAISGDTLTVVRGQEGTNAQIHSAGDIVSLRLTAGSMNALTAWAEKTVPVGTVVGTTDVQTLINKTFLNPTEVTYPLADTVIDPANGSIQTKTLTGNTTFTESLADGKSVVLMINPATFTITWPTTSWVTIAGTATAPTLKASVVNTIVLWQVGGVLYGNFVGSM